MVLIVVIGLIGVAILSAIADWLSSSSTAGSHVKSTSIKRQSELITESAIPGPRNRDPGRCWFLFSAGGQDAAGDGAGFFPRLRTSNFGSGFLRRKVPYWGALLSASKMGPLSGFKRFPNFGGNIVSVCRRCYALVAESNNASELERGEQSHSCDPELLKFWHKFVLGKKE